MFRRRYKIPAAAVAPKFESNKNDNGRFYNIRESPSDNPGARGFKIVQKLLETYGLARKRKRQSTKTLAASNAVTDDVVGWRPCTRTRCWPASS